MAAPAVVEPVLVSGQVQARARAQGDLLEGLAVVSKLARAAPAASREDWPQAPGRILTALAVGSREWHLVEADSSKAQWGIGCQVQVDTSAGNMAEMVGAWRKR